MPFYGTVVGCLDDPGVLEILPRVKRRVVTYGESPDANLRASQIRLEASGTTFEVWEGRTWSLGTVRLPLPGRHNVLNALAAIAVGRELSIPFPTIAKALKDFTGVVRRFETKGERDGVLVLDDYAHHPTEIAATLAAARQVHPARRLVALFQPHLYSRTRGLRGAVRGSAPGLRRRDRDRRVSLAGETAARRDGRPGRAGGPARGARECLLCA